MAIVAIDGSSRRNGKEDCLSTGSVFIKPLDDITSFSHDYVYEEGSTNQRGEIIAMSAGLTYALHLLSVEVPVVYMLTDSEYIFNTITKEWYKNWQRKGWLTAAGEPVKNRRLWENTAELLARFGDDELVVYHIKGHVIPFGKVTARHLINKDPSCKALYGEVSDKFDDVQWSKREEIEYAKKLFEINNGHCAPEASFKEFVVCNTVADLVASFYADKVDLELRK